MIRRPLLGTLRRILTAKAVQEGAGVAKAAATGAVKGVGEHLKAKREAK